MIYLLKRYFLPGLLCFLAIQFAGCKNSEQSTSKPPETVNYSQFTTFNFGKPHVISSQNPVFSWPQFQERIEREIKFSLPGTGLDFSGRDPDLLIYYFAIVDTREDYPLLPYHAGWAAKPFLSRGETFSQYVPHTLVIDMVDTNNNQLVWRGSVRINFDDAEQFYRELPEKVYSLLKQYPTLPDE